MRTVFFWVSSRQSDDGATHFLLAAKLDAVVFFDRVERLSGWNSHFEVEALTVELFRNSPSLKVENTEG
jgi:hypothetical protein